MEDYRNIVNMLNIANTLVINADTGENASIMTPYKRDDVINRLNNMINLVRGILEFIHPNYMYEVSQMYPDWNG